MHLATAVVVGEVVHDDGDGQGDDQNTTKAADNCHPLPECRLRTHAVVAGHCHGDHGDAGPPEGLRDGLELGVGNIFLGEVGHGGEYYDADVQEEHQEAELFRAVAESEAWRRN